MTSCNPPSPAVTTDSFRTEASNLNTLPSIKTSNEIASSAVQPLLSQHKASFSPVPTFGKLGVEHLSLSPVTVDENLVDWDGPDDPANPQNWSVAYRWSITTVLIFMTINVTFASSAPASTLRFIAQHFHTLSEVGNLVITTYLLGFAVGPIFCGPGSELIGRRPVFIVSMVAFTVLHLGQTLATNIPTLLITRFLSGLFAVAPLTNCGGVIADMWPPATVGWPACLFAASVYLGPALGPVISGFIVESWLGWRFVFWVMMMFAGVCTVLCICFLPETYAPILLLNKAKRLRKEDPLRNKKLYAQHEQGDWSFKGLVNRTIFRPFIMLSMEPILVLVTAYLSIVYGLLYALLQVLPVVYIQRRHFTISYDGLMFLSVCIGTTLGAVISLFGVKRYNKLLIEWRGFPPAEFRLLGAMIGSPSLVIGTFWLGWTGEYASVPWYVPGIGTVFIGLGINLIFMSFLSYLVDTYLTYSASAFAANTIIRSAIGATVPLFIPQMFNAMGINWACTLIGIIAVIFMPSPFLFYKYGTKIRGKSRFAPCIDFKVRMAIEREKKEEQEKMERDV